MKTHDAIAVPVEPHAEWTLADLLAVLNRRRGWILAAIAGCLAVAILYWIFATPRYRATATIEVHPQSDGAFGLEATTSDRPSNSVSDSFDENLNLQTEIGILQSDAVALDTIRRANLEDTPDYFDAKPSWLAWLRYRNRPLEPLSVCLEKAPNRRYAALKIFAHHREIAAVAGTRLISVSYSDPSPGRASAVVDALIQSASDLSFASRSKATAQSAEWLQQQLAGLKQQTDELDARAAALDRNTGDFGDESSHNVVLARLDELNSALSAAESRRIVREAIWRDVQSGNPEAISSLAGSSGGSADTQNAFALLQHLRSQQAAVQAQLAEFGKRYGENWPGVAEQRARLADINHSIQAEIERLGERAYNDYEIAVQSENSARREFDEQKSLASRLTGAAVSLRLARQEADQSRVLYAALQGRLQQAGVLEGLHSASFTIVNPALIPSSGHPTTPNLPLLLGCAILAGLLLGSGTALIREITDDAIHKPSDLEGWINIPVFASVPSLSPSRPWYGRLVSRRAGESFTLDAASISDFPLPDPASGFAEGLHRLRALLLLSHSEWAPQVITVMRAESDPQTNRGNAPSIAGGLAATLAQHGAPVLFVDADLRSAGADCDSSNLGLSELLSSGSAVTPRNHSVHANLSVLHAGPRPPCPSELISSPRLHSLVTSWRNSFRFVVIQSPAVHYADALVLAQLSDAVLLCVRAGQTGRATVVPALEGLSRQIPPHAVLGCVLEGASHGVLYAQD